MAARRTIYCNYFSVNHFSMSFTADDWNDPRQLCGSVGGGEGGGVECLKVKFETKCLKEWRSKKIRDGLITKRIFFRRELISSVYRTIIFYFTCILSIYNSNLLKLLLESHALHANTIVYYPKSWSSQTFQGIV